MRTIWHQKRTRSKDEGWIRDIMTRPMQRPQVSSVGEQGRYLNFRFVRPDNRSAAEMLGRTNEFRLRHGYGRVVKSGEERIRPSEPRRDDDLRNQVSFPHTSGIRRCITSSKPVAFVPSIRFNVNPRIPLSLVPPCGKSEKALICAKCVMFAGSRRTLRRRKTFG